MIPWAEEFLAAAGDAGESLSNPAPVPAPVQSVALGPQVGGRHDLRVAWRDAFMTYDFGPGHPMHPVRLDLTMRLAGWFRLFDLPNVTVCGYPEATDEELQRAHGAGLVEAVRTVGLAPWESAPDFGIGDDDTPGFQGMHRSAATIVGGTLGLARDIAAGHCNHGVNIAGGLHHAQRHRCGGFCVYNDMAVAVVDVRERGLPRVVIIDIDAHHGDGTQEIFYNDPSVMTISIHEGPKTLYPGTGEATEIGGPGAEGTAVNVALPPRVEDARWLRAFDAIVPPLVRAFAPDLIVSQHGCDAHRRDPLSHLSITVDAQREAARRIHGLAHEVTGGRWLAVGGGGYDIVDVVPRVWTHLIAEAAGRPIFPMTAVPLGWRTDVNRRLEQAAPFRMSDAGVVEFDAFDDGHDPDDAVDAAILDTRRAVFGYWGLPVGD